MHNRNGQFRFFITAFLLIALLAVCCAASADDLPSNYTQALKYIKNIQPMEASANNVGWNPKQLTEIRDALPEGAVFHFTCKWNGLTFSDESEELDLNKAKKDLNDKTLRLLLSLCPKVKFVDNSKNRTPSNDTFIPLMEEYPEIHFEWLVHLRGEHYCPTTATAYSTLNHTDYGARLKDEHMELLKYIPGLKALDVGHNAFTNLDFLRFFPDLELLIISNNDHVDDLTEVGNLKHLKYLEVHNTHVSDLSPLANCTEMLDLNVSSTLVTDLSPLDGITSLERFWANHLKKLPESEQTRFIELHPDCKPDFTVNGSAISHKWREHERYYRFRRCFRHNIWVPFEEPWPED
jgi:hypothetical protein